MTNAMELFGAIVLTCRILIHLLSQPQAYNLNSMNNTNGKLTYTEQAIKNGTGVAQTSLEMYIQREFR